LNRKATLIVTGLLICCMNSPLCVYAAPETAAADSQTTASAEYAAKKKHVKKKHRHVVDDLVKDRVISKETGEKVKAYLKAHAEEHKAEREKVRSMTDEDRKAYFKEKYPNGKPDIWAEMAAAGVITPDEAQAIKAAMQAKHDGAYKKK